MRPNFVPGMNAGYARICARAAKVAVGSLLTLGLTIGSLAPVQAEQVGPQTGQDARRLSGHGLNNVEVRATSRGMVLADEPLAALAARRVLEEGGNTIDAAVALYFTLAVTQPATAGLGGGGMCLIHDRSNKITESVEFLARPPADGGPIAIPGNVRGFALMHAKYGQLPWSSLLAEPERMAGLGTQVSRAMSRSLAPHEARLKSDYALGQIFLNRLGEVPTEGDQLAQLDLAATLGTIRNRGIAALYTGAQATVLADAIQSAGGRVSRADLRAYRPVVSQPVGIPLGNQILQLPAGARGQEAAATWNALVAGTAPALSGGEGPRTATGFAIVSGEGSAVVCGLSLNAPLGAGRLARGTGILLASAEQEPDLAPALVSNPNNGSLYFAGIGSGGEGAMSAILRVVHQTVGSEGTDMVTAIRQSHRGPHPLVNAVECPAGLPGGYALCDAAVDPQGHGLATELVDRPAR